jgi:uncharacterized iron-regulated membrane protein
MASIRTWHTYLGILIAPSVLFFALTGALQLFSLHEAHGTYHPLPVIEKLASVHKDQVYALGHHEEPPPEAPAAGAQPPHDAHPPAPAEHEDEPAIGTPLLKWFFLVVALGLATSTVLGLWMGLTHIRHKRTGWWLLAIGVVVPLVLGILT